MNTLTKAIMTKKVITVREGTSLFEAFDLMKEKAVRHLPVVNKEDVMIGLLSQRDLNYLRNSKNLTVEMLMTTPILTVDSELPLKKAIQVMLERKISSLIVVNKVDEVCGIVTTDDLLGHLAYLLKDEVKEPEQAPLINATHLQTIGAIANKLSNAGI